jgi:hypothetical protein
MSSLKGRLPFDQLIRCEPWSLQNWRLAQGPPLSYWSFCFTTSIWLIRFAAFALSAIAITFWYGGTKPGIVAVLLSSLIRGFIFEAETSSLSRVLYELVFLTFAILMMWVRRRKEALEVVVADRNGKVDCRE